MDIVSYVYRMDKKVFYKNFIENYNIFILDFRRFSQNIVLRSPGGYSSEKDC